MRYTPVAAEGNPPQVQCLLTSPVHDGPARPLRRQLANHPELFARYLPFGEALLTGTTLSQRVRELVILATAAACGCEYIILEHEPFALAAGFTVADLAAVRDGSRGETWSDLEACAAGAARELATIHDITDPLWDRLAAELTVRQLVELVMLGGNYSMMAGVLRAFRTPLYAGE